MRIIIIVIVIIITWVVAEIGGRATEIHVSHVSCNGKRTGYLGGYHIAIIKNR